MPDDTLILLTTPDFAKLRQMSLSSPKGMLWNDPAMKPFRDKFVSSWQEGVIKPLERELNTSLGSYASLPQGQVTLALTKASWQGTADQPPGLLLLLDARDKSGLLKTNLAELRKQWMATGRSLKTVRIRNVEFAIFPVTTNQVPKTLSKFLWRPPVFAPVSGSPDLQQGPVNPSAKSDPLLDMLSLVLTTSKELVVGQVDSLLVVGNSVPTVEKVVTRLTGGATPTLGETAAYQTSHQALFRDAPFYGWVNVKAFADILGHQPTDSQSSEVPDPFDSPTAEKVIRSTGLAGCKALAFSLSSSTEGSLLDLFLSVPEAARQGIFQILAGPAKEASPPPFIPADAGQFFRWRLDGPQTCATLGKVLTALSPQALGAIKLILDTADARAKQTDPGFDLKQSLLANLGDDLITYERAPRGGTAAALPSPPSLFLLGSPNPDRLAVALKRLFVIFPQGDTQAEREFLGRKIFSVPLPPLSMLMPGPSQGGAPSTLSWAGSGGYVAMSTDTALLEEYLRSSESQAKPLREKAGLLEAAQKVGGMGTGFFGYENEASAMRAAFAAAKNDPGASTNGIGPTLFPALPGISGPEKNLSAWMDFSLLPPFDQVAQYFYFTVYAASVNVDGLSLRVFAPTPPALRSKPVATSASNGH